MDTENMTNETGMEMNSFPEFDEYPTRWFYLGADNQVHGPFSNTEMLQWVDSGYFNDNLMIRTERDDKFYTLFEYTQMCQGSPFHSDIYSMHFKAMEAANMIRQRSAPIPIRVPVMVVQPHANVSTTAQFPPGITPGPVFVNSNGFPVSTPMYVNNPHIGTYGTPQPYNYMTERENPSSSSVSDSPDIDRSIHMEELQVCVQTDDKCVSTDDAPWLTEKIEIGTDVPVFNVNDLSVGTQTAPVPINRIQVARLLKELTGLNFYIR
uniref:GYF domain-containing protein n=2 Tax=Panagrolaimus sp. JU765 TaxID=591449 RepID=A0AC34QWT8_9BILA